MSVKKDQVAVKEAVEREAKLLRTVSGSFSGTFRSRSRSFSTGRWRRRRNVSVSVSIAVNNRRRRRRFRST